MREVVPRELEHVAGEDSAGPGSPARAPRFDGGPERGREHADPPEAPSPPRHHSALNTSTGTRRAPMRAG